MPCHATPAKRGSLNARRNSPSARDKPRDVAAELSGSIGAELRAHRMQISGTMTATAADDVVPHRFKASRIPFEYSEERTKPPNETVVKHDLR